MSLFRLSFFALLLAFSSPALAAKNGDVFGDWTYVCGKPDKKGVEICQIAQTQTIDDPKGKKGRLLRLSLEKMKDFYVLRALLPLGIHLPAGVAVKIDENEQAPMILQQCTSEGCEAAAKVEAPLLAQLKKGKEVRIGFNVGTKTMVIPASLKGFGNAFAALGK